jgi:riboflavin transporter FmnP
MTNNSKNVLKMVYAAICLALCMVLPLLTAQIPQIGSMLSPMHIPVLLCGFIAGPFWAAAVGFIAPLLRYAIFGMPPIMPTGIAMAFELLTYGLISGLLYKMLPKKTANIYVSLIAAMICGRVVWGIVRYIIAGINGGSFTFAAFMAGAVTNAIPGIILHIVLVPILVIALQRAKLIPEK